MGGAPFEAASLIMPDVVTTSQWRDRNKPRDRSPHKVLAAAILDQSLTDLKLRKPNRGRGGRPALNGGPSEVLSARRSRHFDDARAWLLDTQADSLFSFRGCCEVLGIDPDSFRARLLELLDSPAVLPSRRREEVSR